MIGMTGFGYAEYIDSKIQLTFDIKTLNNRYLDIIPSLPPLLSQAELPLREAVKASFQRGRVEVNVRYRELEPEMAISVNQEGAKAWYTVLSGLEKSLGLEDTLSISHIIRMDGVVTSLPVRDIEKLKTLVLDLFAKAAESVQEARKKEGESTKKDILSQIDILEKNIAFIKEKAPLLEEHIKGTIKDKMMEIADGAVDESRILSEVAVMLIRFDINEEICRFLHHVKEFREWAKSQECIGKKLDFLCQEMHREVNTIGSKCPILEINSAVVEMKDALEKVREQLRNIE